MTLQYDIFSIKNEENRKFFYEMLPYVSEYILSFTLKDSSVEVTYASESHRSQIESKLGILKELASQEVIDGADNAKTKVLLDRRDVRTQNSQPIFEALQQHGAITQFGEGAFAYSKLFLNVMDYFYLKSRELGLHFSAQEYKFPTLIPLETFQRGGYFETFPHHIMFQSTIKNDIEVLEQFTQQGVDEELLRKMKLSGNVLKNAACGPIYPMLAHQTLSSKDPHVFLVVGKCFRNEASNIFELARLNEFTMSEVVFIGTDAQVRQGITQAQKLLWDFWIELFELNCSIETASDSFFGGSYKKLKFFQLMGDSKQELRMLLPQHKQYIACSSANFHRTHFTKRYEIRHEDGFCHTACIAFGIERLAYAFLSQLGCDPDKWPRKVLEEIERYTSQKAMTRFLSE
ncbi:hypothetical protein CSB45_01845 [candidate division KSB3 bacterium]|uniref:Aminoacyl-transfer RNA synthetases class-II family profile domain-containing protein n=1 Tax=candidate division KSB3 bacterium TaxID=2044937 RepID=A0A2G6EBP1_9BACT|nr:MAG: hypothetical protein CSB45_01845 [candidate division KSB3 bacterium]